MNLPRELAQGLKPIVDKCGCWLVLLVQQDAKCRPLPGENRCAQEWAARHQFFTFFEAYCKNWSLPTMLKSKSPMDVEVSTSVLMSHKFLSAILQLEFWSATSGWSGESSMSVVFSSTMSNSKSSMLGAKMSTLAADCLASESTAPCPSEVSPLSNVISKLLVGEKATCGRHLKPEEHRRSGHVGTTSPQMPTQHVFECHSPPCKNLG